MCGVCVSLAMPHLLLYMQFQRETKVTTETAFHREVVNYKCYRANTVACFSQAV